jgi:Fe-S cluster assembly protein SufD
MRKQFIDLNKDKRKRLKFDKPGQYVVYFHNRSRELEIELNKGGVKVDIFGIYIGKDKDEFYLNSIQHHKVGKSNSSLLIKGIFDNASKFNFQGLIKIDKQASKSFAYQKNQNILNSDSCEVDSKPFLEIDANDVYCTHGSTTGKIPEDQLYYLHTRGISKNEGEELLLKGFIKEVFDEIENLGFAKEIEDYKKKIKLML